MPATPGDKLAAYRWLCGAISPSVGPQVLRANLPQTEADWQYIVQVGSANLVLPDLFLAIREKGIEELVPGELVDALDSVFTLNRLHRARLRMQVIEVSRLLNGIGIKPIWLKGATSLMAPDWESAARMMLDLDFWIPGVEAQVATLACLAGAGYTIQANYCEQNFLDCHHFAPRVKSGDPARIEIHRTIVPSRFAGLLPDQDARQAAEWIDWEGVSVGRLAAPDRLMHSYLQCIDGAEMGEGKISLMKALDFVKRAPACADAATSQRFFELLDQQPWRAAARPFLSFLVRDFGLTSPLPVDHSYLRTLERRLRFPGSLYVADQFIKRIGEARSIGAPWHWRRRLWNFVLRVRQG